MTQAPLYRLQKKFSVLARLDRKYFRLANRVRIARFLVRAGVKQNLKYLMGINLNELKRQRPKLPEEDARSYFQALTEEAKSGPVFSEEALMAVQQAGDVLSKDQAKSLANMISVDENPDLSSLDLVVQWLTSTNSFPSEGTTYTQVEEAARNASESALEAPLPEVDPNDPRTSEEGKKLIVYQFPDGYFITIVPAGECRVYEGTLMDNCIKDVWSNAPEVTILSLRDPNNKPHVSISLSNPGNKILELRGKQNKPPVQKYMKYITEFMKAGIIKENLVYWALFNKEKFKTELVDKVAALNNIEDEEDREAANEHFDEVYRDENTGLVSLAINQTPFKEFLPILAKKFPVAVSSNKEFPTKDRDSLILDMLTTAQDEEDISGLVIAAKDFPIIQESIKRIKALDRITNNYVILAIMRIPSMWSDAEIDSSLTKILQNSNKQFPLSDEGLLKSLRRIAQKDSKRFPSYFPVITPKDFFSARLGLKSNVAYLNHILSSGDLLDIRATLSNGGLPGVQKALAHLHVRVDSLPLASLVELTKNESTDNKTREDIAALDPQELLTQDPQQRRSNFFPLIQLYSLLPEGPSKKQWEETLLQSSPDMEGLLSSIKDWNLYKFVNMLFIPGALDFLRKVYARYARGKRTSVLYQLFGTVRGISNQKYLNILHYFNPSTDPEDKKELARAALRLEEYRACQDLSSTNLRFIAQEHPKLFEDSLTEYLSLFDLPSRRASLKKELDKLLPTVKYITPPDYFHKMETLHKDIDPMGPEAAIAKFMGPGYIPPGEE